MKLTLKHVLAAILLMLSFATPVTAGPGEDAMAASARGDYATALRLLRPLADQGDAQAQYNLGVLYDNGQGVPQDNGEAMKWYRKAADQGEARGQNNLANMYVNRSFCTSSLNHFALPPENYFIGPSTLLSTIFRASSNAPAGVENGIVSASLSPSSSYTVTMKPAWRVRSRRWKL
jgi:TPR repeat protein